MKFYINHSIKNQLSYHPQLCYLSDIGPLFINKWVDGCNYLNKWYEAQIIDIKKNNKNLCYLRFRSCESILNEWIDISKQKERIARLHKVTIPGKKFNTKLQTENDYHILNDKNEWVGVRLIEMDGKNNYSLFYYFYSNNNNKYEWINNDSYRIAPYRDDWCDKNNKLCIFGIDSNVQLRVILMDFENENNRIHSASQYNIFNENRILIEYCTSDSAWYFMKKMNQQIFNNKKITVTKEDFLISWWYCWCCQIYD